MRVIVTRPAHSADRTAQRLTELGHEALFLPLTRPVHDAATAAHALDTSTGAIAVTSAEAIRVLSDLGFALKPHLSRPLFGVGRATAAAAERIGFAATDHSDGSGIELADLIAERRSLSGAAPLTYLAGSPRTPGFEARLTELGIPFSTTECYRMEDVEPAEEQLEGVVSAADVVLLYSAHTAARFFGLPYLATRPDILAKMRYLCLSSAIADILPHTLAGKVEIAATPDEDSLLALLGRG
jgi:uroporphyrinogen-III synthase